MVAALIARTRSRSDWPSCNRPCCSRAGSKVGIITLSRLPHTRSDASHSAVSASLIVAPYLRLRFLVVSSLPDPTVSRRRSARTACLRCQPVVAHSSSEDPSLLRSSGRPVTLRYCRHHLAPRAHADLSRHRRHRTNSMAPTQSSARSCPVTFWMRQCALSASNMHPGSLR
jgi:hypothetical protein